MPVNRIYFLIVLFAVPALAADADVSLEFLEFLGGYETEVNGEWVTPVDLDTETLTINDTSADLISDEAMSHD